MRLMMMTNKNSNKNDIRIELVLMHGNEPTFVEYYSSVDSRYHIINADAFTEIFGISTEELKVFSKVRYENNRKTGEK